MIALAFLFSVMSLGVAIAVAIELNSTNKIHSAMDPKVAALFRQLNVARLDIADLKSAVENMRATAGPLPPVILHRTVWEQDEMAMELQPSESAAILARLDAAEQVIAVTEDRLGIVERSQNSGYIRHHITAVAVEIRRHMAALRTDFEVQSLRRLKYCEESVEAVERRFTLAELAGFGNSPRKAKRKKS